MYSQMQGAIHFVFVASDAHVRHVGGECVGTQGRQQQQGRHLTAVKRTISSCMADNFRAPSGAAATSSGFSSRPLCAQEVRQISNAAQLVRDEYHAGL